MALLLDKFKMDGVIMDVCDKDAREGLANVEDRVDTVEDTVGRIKPVAYSGSYNELSDKPTIPTDNAQLSNGAGYITSSGSCAYATASDHSVYAESCDSANEAVQAYDSYTLDGHDSSYFSTAEFVDDVPHSREESSVSVDVPNVDADLFGGHAVNYFGTAQEVSDIKADISTLNSFVKLKNYPQANSNCNANDYRETGLLALNSYDGSNVNFPYRWGIMLVFASWVYGSQTFYGANGEVYSRFFDNQIWTEWKKLS